MVSFLTVNARRSDEAVELHSYVKKIGNMPEYCCMDYLMNFFESLNFPRGGIEKIDASLSKMSRLRILNLSYNKITVLPGCLPPKIQELNLTGNLLTDV